MQVLLAMPFTSLRGLGLFILMNALLFPAVAAAGSIFGEGGPGLLFRRLLRGLKRHAFLPVLLLGALWVGGHLAMRSLPSGRLFDLTPHDGPARVRAVIYALFLAFSMYVLCILPALTGNKHGRAWSWIAFPLVALPFDAMLTDQAIAAVQQNSAFVLVRPFPFTPQTIDARQLAEVRCTATESCRTLHLRQLDGYGPNTLFNFVAVWSGDDVTNQHFDDLIAALEESRKLAKTK